MKKYLNLLFVLLLALPMYAEGKPRVKFDSTTHDFGYIQETGGNVTHQFLLTNTGDAPLIISTVRSACGCTVPHYSKKPIAPGESRPIKVTFSPKGRPGEFHKEVKVYTNAKKAPAKLTIKGIVIPKESLNQ